MTTKNNIETLRTMLFDTMERLLDEKDPMEAQQARSVANVGRVIVDSAKIEIAAMKQLGYSPTFLQTALPANPKKSISESSPIPKENQTGM